MSGCRREAVCTEVQPADRDCSGPRANRVLRSRGADHRCCTSTSLDGHAGSFTPLPTANARHIPSKVNTLEAFVPTTAPTVTFEYDVLSVVGALSRHCTVVAEDQDVVPQSTSATACPVGVKPYTPKFSPEIVTVAPPDVAALTGTS